MPLPETLDEALVKADPPVLDLRSIGDGRRFYRTLARVIVRRALISAGVIPDPDGCQVSPSAG
jgi:hypothetical protein